MSAIIEISKEVDEKQLKKAEKAHQEILARTFITASNLLELGRLFKTVRDEKLYRLLGASTFGEYCGFPEISFGRSTIYSFIKIYEKYSLLLKADKKLLITIGHRKLQIINPVVEEDPDFWLDNANVLSESDLINAVRGFQGKPKMMPKPRETESVYPFSFEEYKEFVVNHPCIVCDNPPPSDPAHFPTTRGAGAPDDHIIPLCRKCHRQEDDDGFDFLWLHKDKICTYFFNMMKSCYALLSNIGGIK